MKKYRVTIMPAAKKELLEIGEYIALDNPVRAITFIEEITDLLKKTLSIFRYSGKVAEDLNLGEEIRMITHGNYNSYYRVLEDKQIVEVLFIFNGSRDMQAFISSL